MLEGASLALWASPLIALVALDWGVCGLRGVLIW
jgi:hypothetical protein